MKKIIFLLLILLVLFLLTACSKLVITKDTLAQCLTASGAAMYGSEYCGHCQSQKNMFGKAFQYIDYVDCDKNTAACQDIIGLPTWIINGKQYPGVQSLTQLSSLANC